MTLWQRITSLTTASGDGGATAAADGRSTVAFTMAVIALGAKMAKADGVVSPVEIEAFHQVFKTPPDQAAHVAQVFDLAQRDIAGFETYARQVRDLLGSDQQKLRDVIECLFRIASADRALHPGEDAFLEIVAGHFGFSQSTYRHIRAQFVEDTSAPYDVLGLDPSVSDADFKARHRKLVRENHPDLMAGRGMPAEAIEGANRKLATINAAFATIAKERGL
jgi:DnaJ like chaperone protein